VAAADENESILRRYVDELNKRNFAILDQVVADVVVFGPDETVTRDEYRQQIDGRISRLPDYHVSIDEASSLGDVVSIRWTFRGTDSTTGEKISGQAATAYRFVDGRIVEVRSVDQAND